MRRVTFWMLGLLVVSTSLFAQVNWSDAALRGLMEINRERASNGAPPVELDPALTAMAIYNNTLQIYHGDLQHWLITDAEFEECMQYTLYDYKEVDENLSRNNTLKGNPPERYLVQTFRHSPPHMASINNPQAVTTGFSFVDDGTGTIWYTIYMGIR